MYGTQATPGGNNPHPSQMMHLLWKKIKPWTPKETPIQENSIQGQTPKIRLESILRIYKLLSLYEGEKIHGRITTERISLVSKLVHDLVYGIAPSRLNHLPKNYLQFTVLQLRDKLLAMEKRKGTYVSPASNPHFLDKIADELETLMHIQIVQEQDKRHTPDTLPEYGKMLRAIAEQKIAGHIQRIAEQEIVEHLKRRKRWPFIPSLYAVLRDL